MNGYFVVLNLFCYADICTVYLAGFGALLGPPWKDGDQGLSSVNQMGLYFDEGVPEERKTSRSKTIFNPIRLGLFSRSPGPRGVGGGRGSEAQTPKIKVNINQLK